MHKKEMRQQMLQQRLQLSATQRLEAAQAALPWAQQLLSGKERVMFYMPFRGELDPLPLAEWLLQQGGEVVLPLTDQATRRLTPARVADLSSLQPAAYGILEPQPGSYQEVEPTTLQAVIVPGAAFDRRGYRLGYGGGYYDRFLPRLASHCLTIGYGYDWQLLERVPADPWDQSLGYLVSDQRCWTVPRL